METPLLDANSLTAQANHSQSLEQELAIRNLKERIQPGPDHDKKLREACKGFETIFITKLWQEMRATLPKDGYLHSKDEEFYLSMFDQEVSKKLADSGGIGLGKMLYDQLKASMEDASRTTSPSRAQNAKPINALTPEIAAGKTLATHRLGQATGGAPGELPRESMAAAAPGVVSAQPLDSNPLYTPLEDENQAEAAAVGPVAAPLPGSDGQDPAVAARTLPPAGKMEPGPLRPVRRPGTPAAMAAGQAPVTDPAGTSPAMPSGSTLAAASAPGATQPVASAPGAVPPGAAALGAAPIRQATETMASPANQGVAPVANPGVDFAFGLPASSPAASARPAAPARPAARENASGSGPKAAISTSTIRPGTLRERPTTGTTGLAQPDAAPAANTALRTGPGARTGRVVKPILPRGKQAQGPDGASVAPAAAPGTWSPAGTQPNTPTAPLGAPGSAGPAVQTDEPTLTAVEQLAGSIAGNQATGPSPASRQTDRTRLAPQAAPESPADATPADAMSFHFTPDSGTASPQAVQAPQGTAPTVAAPTAPAQPAPLDRLDRGIRNKQGAVHNEGGPESALPIESLKPVSTLQSRGAQRPAPMLWPTDGQVTSGFGWRRSPFSGERTFHAGVDIAAEYGDPVKASWDGRVVFAGEREGYGKLVVLEHGNGWQTFYGHNSDNTAKVGDYVTAGTVVAKAGSTGHSTGPHVHFEVRQNDLAWDPEKVRQQLMAGTNVSDAS